MSHPSGNEALILYLGRVQLGKTYPGAVAMAGPGGALRLSLGRSKAQSNPPIGFFSCGVHHFLVISHVYIIERKRCPSLCLLCYRDIFYIRATLWLFLASVIHREGFICVLVC